MDFTQAFMTSQHYRIIYDMYKTGFPNELRDAKVEIFDAFDGKTKFTGVSLSQTNIKILELSEDDIEAMTEIKALVDY